ncbi:MAG: hypothetical protein COX07_07355 [Bacteroidetes bacterium CG23_combo_of_CG06-09_8_20_14_all_32_9]|nr:MAG: hypothetical protein COX07_07355 [Bacteroidetes bacterium CG23_combo_of_CG06-09_8_20_14_all_32_9]
MTRRQRNVIQKQKEIVVQKNKIIERRNKDITDSITYAKRIQEAILTSSEYCKQILPQHFILFKPKDIVSGDFYWAYASHNNNAIWTVADCTGHGVPGAFMSMIGSSLLNEIIIEKGITSANEILNELKSHIIKALGQTGATGETRDGMDASLCIWHKDTNILEFAGAYNPLYIVRSVGNSPLTKGGAAACGLQGDLSSHSASRYELFEIKADRQPVGYHPGKEDSPFTKQEIQLQTGDTVYLFSDGYADQFGGEKNKKFTYKKFKDLLVETCPGMSQQGMSLQIKTMEEQKQILDETITKWRGEQEQVDDICVIGVRI